jgi:hypothetical protein
VGFVAWNGSVRRGGPGASGWLDSMVTPGPSPSPDGAWPHAEHMPKLDPDPVPGGPPAARTASLCRRTALPDVTSGLPRSVRTGIQSFLSRSGQGQ